MYNIFPKKNTYLILLFFLISLQSFSQNLSSKINEDEKFIKLLKLSKEANSEYFKSNFFSIQVYSGQYNHADSILYFVNEKYLNDSIFFFF